MKSQLIFSVILWAAVSIRAATIVPSAAATTQQEDEYALDPEADADFAVAAGRAADLPQARSFSFCLDGWLSYRGSCYFLSNIPDTWGKAESYCASFDASLASVRNIWEYRFLQNLAGTGGHTYAWIGGYFFEGEWRWEDGSAFTYMNWDSESANDRYQCLQLNSEGSKGWTNHGCYMSFPFICQARQSC